MTKPKEEKAITPLPETGPNDPGGFAVEDAQPGGGLPGPSVTGEIPATDEKAEEISDKAVHREKVPDADQGGSKSK